MTDLIAICIFAALAYIGLRAGGVFAAQDRAQRASRKPSEPTVISGYFTAPSKTDDSELISLLTSLVELATPLMNDNHRSHFGPRFGLKWLHDIHRDKFRVSIGDVRFCFSGQSNPMPIYISGDSVGTFHPTVRTLVLDKDTPKLRGIIRLAAMAAVGRATKLGTLRKDGESLKDLSTRLWIDRLIAEEMQDDCEPTHAGSSAINQARLDRVMGQVRMSPVAP